LDLGLKEGLVGSLLLGAEGDGEAEPLLRRLRFGEGLSVSGERLKTKKRRSEDISQDIWHYHRLKGLKCYYQYVKVIMEKGCN
jgi:hypothetical protein